MTPQEITLDLNPSFSRLKTVHCSQYDNNVRQITVKLQDGGTDVDVSTYTIYIEGTKPDKHGFSYALADIGTVSGNTVTFYVQTQMCAVPGLTIAEIVLTNGTDRIGSANFNLAVERAGLAEDIDISETDIPAYVDGAQQAAAEAEQAKETAVSAAETAQGVLESIPEDYSDLSNDVDDLKSALEQYEGIFTGNVDESVQNWLDVHPEATTTVEDGSLTEAKFSTELVLKTIKDYVTPEMYGAKGDGVTDDTSAIQSAIDTGKPVWLLKNYKTTGTVYLSETSGYFNNLGSITYTGTDYAVAFSGAVNTFNCNLGIITATDGGCLKISSADGWKQYIKVEFDEFKANASKNCVLIESTTDAWVNELKFSNGRFSRGTYAVYCANPTNAVKGHYNFYNVGFEGVTYGMMLDSKISKCVFYGCRCEESITRMFVTNAQTNDNLNTVFWYGPFALGFLDGLNYTKVFIYGNVLLKNGATINVTNLMVYNNHLYGLEPFYRQRYTGGWKQDADLNYYQESFDGMNTIQTDQTLVTMVRLPDLSATEQKATFKIDLNTITPPVNRDTTITNVITLNITIAPNTTLEIADSEGNNLFTYTSRASTTQYGLIGKLYYMANFGLCFEINGIVYTKTI